MTDRDFADKEWLRGDSFQIIDPGVALAVLIVGGFAIWLFFGRA